MKYNLEYRITPNPSRNEYWYVGFSDGDFGRYHLVFKNGLLHPDSSYLNRSDISNMTADNYKRFNWYGTK